MIQDKKQQLFVSNRTLPFKDKQIHFSASRYSNNIILIINATGTIGSILQAQLEAQGQDQIYEISTKFGATDSEFYEVIFRRILDLVYVQMKVEKEIITTLIISLPLKSKQFDEKEYYQIIYQEIQKEIRSVA